MSNTYIKTFWKEQNNLAKLLIVNVAVFVVIVLLKAIFFLFGSPQIADAIVRFFSMPASLGKLLFKPWTPFTYMFLHEDFWHILGNMLWLFFLGQLFVMHISDRHVWRVYLLGGLAGALMFLVVYNIFPAFAQVRNFSVILGASAAVSAIVIAITVYKPKQIIYFFGVLAMPLWLLGALYVLFDLAMLPVDNSGGHIAHLGGALFGLWFALQYKKGKDITSFMDGWKNPFKKKSKMKVVKNSFRPGDYEYNESKHTIEEEIDRILEKISKHGYKSLTRKEREFLKKYSRYQ